MAFSFLQLLMDTSFILIEPVVNQTLGTSVGAPGAVTITPPSMTGIYAGALLVVGGSQEIITVTSTTATTFLATFANTHASTDSLQGATFPSGQPNHALFSQSEVLGYAADAQNNFLLAVQHIYAVTTQTITSGVRIYDTAADCIRMERVQIGGTALENVSTRDLDMNDPNWQQGSGGDPHQWYSDEVGNLKWGVAPVPTLQSTAERWYAQRGSTSPLLTDNLLVHDIFVPYIRAGVLFKCWNKDGESRDPLRAQWAKKKFDLGIMLGSKLMSGTEAALKSSNDSQ
jgi:hypothetical protein